MKTLHQEEKLELQAPFLLDTSFSLKCLRLCQSVLVREKILLENLFGIFLKTSKTSLSGPHSRKLKFHARKTPILFSNRFHDFQKSGQVSSVACTQQTHCSFIRSFLFSISLTHTYLKDDKEGWVKAEKSFNHLTRFMEAPQQ